MAKKLRNTVVVITGASSGIGRAAAAAFAKEGASVVVAARREEPLAEVAAACERLGGRGLAVPTDVTDEAAVRALARRAVEAFGRIDVWVNNAAAGIYGRFEDTPSDVYRAVIETDLFGYIHGARAALPVFRKQGGGRLINVGSVVSTIPMPYAGAYAIAKHGVLALGESLRQELALDGTKTIHVTTLLPATIDTPFFEHAANYSGRKVKAMPPVYPAEQVAKAIVEQATAKKPRREVHVGNAGRLMTGQFLMSPAAAERAMATMVDRQHLAKEPAPATSGSVLRPMASGTGVSGGWKGAEQTRLRQALALGLAVVPGVLAWRRLGPRATTALTQQIARSAAAPAGKSGKSGKTTTGSAGSAGSSRWQVLASGVSSGRRGGKPAEVTVVEVRPVRWRAPLRRS